MPGQLKFDDSNVYIGISLSIQVEGEGVNIITLNNEINGLAVFPKSLTTTGHK